MRHTFGLFLEWILGTRARLPGLMRPLPPTLVRPQIWLLVSALRRFVRMLPELLGRLFS